MGVLAGIGIVTIEALLIALVIIVSRWRVRTIRRREEEIANRAPWLDDDPYAHITDLDGAPIVVPVVDAGEFIGALHVDSITGGSRRELLTEAPPQGIDE